MTRNLTVLATLCFAFPICAQDDEHPWKTFGEGSRVKTINRFEQGKKYACEIWEFPTDDAVTRAWLCKDVKVPGGALRIESVSRQPQAQAKLTARVVKLSEKVKIAGQELDGAVVETRIDGPAVKYKGKAWHSPDVPGFQVKSEFDTSEGRLTSEVVEFEKK